jgi:hypothetical protein
MKSKVWLAKCIWGLNYTTTNYKNKKGCGYLLAAPMLTLTKQIN